MNRGVGSVPRPITNGDCPKPSISVPPGISSPAPRSDSNPVRAKVTLRSTRGLTCRRRQSPGLCVEGGLCPPCRGKRGHPLGGMERRISLAGTGLLSLRGTGDEIAGGTGLASRQAHDGGATERDIIRGMRKFSLPLLVVALVFQARTANQFTLSIDSIMRGPELVGYEPAGVRGRMTARLSISSGRNTRTRLSLRWTLTRCSGMERIFAS